MPEKPLRPERFRPRGYRVTRLRLENWRNFSKVDIALRPRMFIIGPNASGKSNLLDALRFLRDVAKDGGGLQKAVDDRGGISKIRCLSARRYSEVAVEVEIAAPTGPSWTYSLSFKQDKQSRAVVSRESVSYGTECLVQRPTEEDQEDIVRLSQTFLEQVNSNRNFRPLVQFLRGVSYVHVLPALVRDPGIYKPRQPSDDPFGRGFMDRLGETPDKTREQRLKVIERALKLVVPQLEDFRLERDSLGVPHLEALYKHWRPNAGRQREDQFSDGTLRLIGLLWALQDGEGLLLLEEPEISLHEEIVRNLAPSIEMIQQARRRQVLVSTHSRDLLMDPGIEGEEVVVLRPSAAGASAEVASSIPEIAEYLRNGIPVGEAVLPLTKPEGAFRLALVAS